MDVEVAEKSGACYGVERALKLARNAANGLRSVCTLGPLIHNPLVVAELEKQGVGVAETLDDARCEVLVLRSHGTAPQVVEEANERGFEVVDATCPYVSKVQRMAQRLGAQGYGVVIVGEPGHAEVEGIRAWGGDSVVAVTDDAAKLPPELPERVGVVVQTTQSQQAVDEIVAALDERVDELRVEETVCFATRERQHYACELAGRVDVMVVVGGKNSGNTRRLFESCSKKCPRTYHVESAAELDRVWFAGARRVGITAGASTPAHHIEAVEAFVRAL